MPLPYKKQHEPAPFKKSNQIANEYFDNKENMHPLDSSFQNERKNIGFPPKNPFSKPIPRVQEFQPGRLETKSHFIPFNSDNELSHGSSANALNTQAKRVRFETPVENFSFQRHDKYRAAEDYTFGFNQNQPGKPYPSEENDSINFLLEKYENMDLGLDIQLPKSNNFNLDRFEDLIN